MIDLLTVNASDSDMTNNFSGASNGTLDATSGGGGVPDGAALLAFVCLAVVSAVGTLGNLMVIAALVSSRKLICEMTTKLVVILALSDLLFCLLSVPLTAVPFLAHRWPFGDVVCQLYPVLFYGQVAVSLLLIMLIAANRMTFIVATALYGKVFSKVTLRAMITFCWLFPFALLMLPLLRLWGECGYDPTTFSCTIRTRNGQSPRALLFVLSFAVPCTVISLCYTAIWWHVRGRASSSLLSKGKQRAIHLAKLFGLIFGLFVLCFAPSLLVELVFTKERYPYVYVFSLIMVCMNSALNPIIYFALSAQYRRAFLGLFSTGPRGPVDTSSGDSMVQRSSLRQKLSSITS